MAYFASQWQFAQLVNIRNVGAGLLSNEDFTEHLPATSFLDKTGKVVEIDDTGYDAERPTGYEPIYYLIDFDSQRVWIESDALRLFGKKES
jgi:hypothetical protein